MPLPAPFVVQTPARARTPVIVEVPHAGLTLDKETAASLVCDPGAIKRDADLFVHELYARATDVGATLIFSPFSRYVVDLNRSVEDLDDSTVVGGRREPRATRGLVWRLTSDNQRAIDRPLPRAEIERRVRAVYKPYHDALATLIHERRHEFGFAMVLAGHSMPSIGRVGHGDPARIRADVVPGTRGRTSAAGAFIDAVDAHARAAGFSVEHDTPYRGGFTTAHYGRPREKVHVVQVELARRLYMDEANLTKIPEKFEKLRAFCTDLVIRLGEMRPR